MIKICKERWELNKEKLQKQLEVLSDFAEYDDLVRLTIDVILNHDDLKLNVNRIRMIDDGDEKGIYLFIIPFDKNQPSEQEYLMTYVSYDNCYCEYIGDIVYAARKDNEKLKELLIICHDIIMHTINPYDNEGMFEIVSEDDN